MKRDLSPFIMHVATVMILVAITLLSWMESDQLRKDLARSVEQINHALTLGEQSSALATQWEQRWRDCQAALSMLRTPHTADAVNDVTMP